MSDHDHPSVWANSFSQEQRTEQLEDDASAWRGIIGILLAIVTMGSSMAALVVWAIAKFS